jgi:hypothetical protein
MAAQHSQPTSPQAWLWTHPPPACIGSKCCRYFYATLGLGTPSRTFQLIIDTGSTITYVPCWDCKHCGKHEVGSVCVQQGAAAAARSMQQKQQQDAAA